LIAVTFGLHTPVTVTESCNRECELYHPRVRALNGRTPNTSVVHAFVIVVVDCCEYAEHSRLINLLATAYRLHQCSPC